MPRRRPIEVFSLSFLDCLCCGFGAILLLFILSIGSGGTGPEDVPAPSQIQVLRERLDQLRRSVADRAEQLETSEDPAERERAVASVQSLETSLTTLREERDTLEKQLGREQKTRAEAERLLQSFDFADLPPIGLPTGATHVAFVIDTSGSMRHPFTKYLHEAVLEQIESILRQLEGVEAVQFIDSSGNYILSRSRGSWLPDSPALRQQALRSIRTYPGLSVSDPAPGITRAFKDLHKGLNGDQRMAIYMLGDDFRGATDAFLVKLDALNPRSRVTGERQVSVSAVGFPTLANPFQLGNPQGNVRFANLMREVADDHGGVLILKPRI